MFTYEINGKRYVQKKLVLGQIQQVLEVLKDSDIGTGEGVSNFLVGVGKKLPALLSIILVEEGKSPREVDRKVLEEEFKEHVDLDLALKVIEDFFSCNPVSLYSETLRKILEKATGGIVGEN